MLANLTSGLITKGLGLPATRGLVTMHYHLFIDATIPEPPKPEPLGGGGGGHVPVGYGRGYTGGRMGGAVNMRGNVPFNYLTPARNGGEAQRIVTVRVKMGDVETTKEYMTPKAKRKIKVTLTGLFKSARDAIKVVTEGLFSLINKTK